MKELDEEGGRFREGHDGADDDEVTRPPNPEEALAIRQAISEHRALEARIGTWAQRYGEWREAQALLDVLESGTGTAPADFKARVEELRCASEAALEAVQLRLGG